MSKCENQIAVDQSTTHKLHDSSWSLGPLFIWLRLFGIVLNKSSNSATVQNYLGRSVRFLALFCMVAVRIYIIYDDTHRIISALKAQSVATQLWSEALRGLTKDLALITIQITNLVVSCSRWKQLWSCIRRIERLMNFEKIYYIRLRRTCLMGIMWLILVS